MAWEELGYERGWTAYWENHERRMYAKEGGAFGGTHHFREKPATRQSAWSVFRAWVNSR